jgi:release factor glutamine methyltransferase
VTLRDALAAAVHRLAADQVPSPRMNAELSLMFTLSCDRAYLFAHPERELTQEEVSRYDDALAKRTSGIPSQYITGHQEFWGMDFIVTPAVLIPRPETEHVIETVLPLARALARPRFVDVGTGSGCIALSLLKELPEAEVHATDISGDALEIARANAARLAPAFDRGRGGDARRSICFHQTDLLDGFAADSFDFVVSNPPYVGHSEEDQVQLEVRKFEPAQAVFAGETGMEVISRLIPQARLALKPGGWLVMEISGAIAKRVESALVGWGDVSLVNDLQQIPRVAVARRI